MSLYARPTLNRIRIALYRLRSSVSISRVEYVYNGVRIYLQNFPDSLCAELGDISDGYIPLSDYNRRIITAVIGIDPITDNTVYHETIRYMSRIAQSVQSLR